MTSNIHDAFIHGLGRSVAPMAFVTTFMQRGRGAHPGIHITDEVLAYELGVRAHKHAGDNVDAWSQTLEVEDLFLAIGCGAQADGAHEALEAAYGRELRGLLSRYARGRLTVEDLYQSLRERVFVTTESREARIMEYSGKGLLKNWLRVVAVRMAIDQTRSEKKSRAEVLTFASDELFAETEDELDLEMDFLKKKYRADFKVAIERALADLKSEERNLLRQQIIGGLSIDQIGALHNIHRATAARRLARARESLLLGTRKELMSLLRIDREEFDSIMGLISSNLDVSFARMLGQNTRSPHGD